MPQKPRSRKRREIVTSRTVAAAFVVLLLGGLGWYSYNTYVVKPAPIFARIDTTYGPIEVELFPASAPKTVANFVSLAQSGFYNNLVWHRIVKGFVIQTGDPNTRNAVADRSTWGSGGSSTTVPLEIDPSLHNYAGYLGMARAADPNSGSSQFYINLSNSTSNLGLDGNYTVFGKVVGGWSVVMQIADVQVYTTAKDFSQPIVPVYITDIMIVKNP